jgi:hypothetical protein
VSPLKIKKHPEKNATGSVARRDVIPTLRVKYGTWKPKKLQEAIKNCKQPDTLAHYRQAVCELIENEQTAVIAQWR